jgi:hypothetical protein
MERWEAPESIFAPVVAAVPPGTAWAGFGNSLLTVARRIPRVTRPMNVRDGGFSPTHEESWIRRVSWSSEPSFSKELLFIEERPGGTVIDIYWSLGLSQLKDGLMTPAIPADYSSAILQTFQFQVLGEGIQGAPQLALVRHLWTEEVIAASHHAIVFGGQHHWKDEWWNEKLVGQGTGE